MATTWQHLYRNTLAKGTAHSSYCPYALPSEPWLQHGNIYIVTHWQKALLIQAAALIPFLQNSGYMAKWQHLQNLLTANFTTSWKLVTLSQNISKRLLCLTPSSSILRLCNYASDTFLTCGRVVVACQCVYVTFVVLQLNEEC
jgi:hypothetical protein